MKRNLLYETPDRSPNRLESVNNVRYKKLIDPVDHGFSDIQYTEPPPKIPWKAICLASVLFLFGGCLIGIGVLLLTGIISANYYDRMWPLFVLGLLMFIPGAYHVRIAYYAFVGENGFSFDDIPDFN